jgi:hypothetical protein
VVWLGGMWDLWSGRRLRPPWPVCLTDRLNITITTPPQGCSKKCACQGQYEAVYGEDGALEVRQGDGKRVWRKRKWLQPKVLRPWPLTN